uniref:Uncharacterized protein n=1 Tax=Lepeophtheirus salmonis TaxID=72036 RepID=A0A0K2VCX6_LEPSM
MSQSTRCSIFKCEEYYETIFAPLPILSIHLLEDWIEFQKMNEIVFQ